MKNRYIFKIMIVFAILSVASACKNLLDDIQPVSALQQSVAFSTPSLIDVTVTGVYDAAQSGFYAAGAVRGYPFGAAHVAQGDNRGEDVVNTQAFYQITYQATYDPTTANNDFHFQTLFSLVNRANATLAGLETVVPMTGLTQANIDAYKGECRFLRALAYHELLKHFARPYSDNPTAEHGGMPYKTTAVIDVPSAAASVGDNRASVADNYAKIIEDLDFAESVLPTARGSANLTITRATKGAAIALKTRVYQHMSNWAKVVEEGNKLAPQSAAPFSSPAANGTYNLTASPYGPFSSGSSKGNSESIFSIDNDPTDNPGVNGSLAQVYNTSVAPITGRALVAISPILWNQDWFNANDIRKSNTMVEINLELPAGGGKGGYFTRKYTDVIGQSDNAPIIRYAEVLLNVAEAIQRQSGTPDARAFALYRAVRGRGTAVDPNYDEITDFLTGNDLLQAIYNERRIEFVCEGLRWGDIHRLAQDPTFGTNGIPAKVYNGVANLKPLYTGLSSTTTTFMATPANTEAFIPYADRRFLWPIPTSETALNPILAAQQNPGY
jgi:starch-binding outer membrane protein, SusD/RagB family